MDYQYPQPPLCNVLGFNVSLDPIFALIYNQVVASSIFSNIFYFDIFGEV